MRSQKLEKAINAGEVSVRTGRNVTGQVLIKFRNPNVKDRVVTAYAIRDQLKPESYTNLSLTYSAEQLKNSNLEDLLIERDLELQG